MSKTTQKKSESNKASRKAALMQKAEANRAVSNSSTSATTVVVDATTSEVVINKESFKKALDLLLSSHPADGRNKRADFSAVLSLLLKMNVDTKSKKEISFETEKSLNLLGFTANNMEGKEHICKDAIPELVDYLFNGYQKKHPQFCAIDADILHNCSEELEAISKKIWHPIVQYIACQTASCMTEEDAKHLLSGKNAEITDVLKNIKCAEQTRSALANIAPELGKLVLTLKASSPMTEVISSGNCPFAGLNPNDFPAYEEQSAENKSSGEPSPNAINSVKEEDSKKMVVEELKSSPEEKDSKDAIVSKQESNVIALAHAVEVLKKYGDMLRKLEAIGFTIEDAKSLVDAEAIGFSIKELLNSPTVVDTISAIVDALK